MTFVIASAVVAIVTGSVRVGLDTSDVSRVLRLCSESCKASEEAQSVSMVDSAWQKFSKISEEITKTFTFAVETWFKTFLVGFRPACSR